MWRYKENIKPIVSSAVASRFPNGVFITKILFLVAVSKSTLSTPTPALPTTFKFLQSARISDVNFVADLIRIPSY